MKRTLAIVDRDEYLETIRNITRIAKEANQFLDDYIKYMNREPNAIPKEEFRRRYSQSELGLQ